MMFEKLIFNFEKGYFMKPASICQEWVLADLLSVFVRCCGTGHASECQFFLFKRLAKIPRATS